MRKKNNQIERIENVISQDRFIVNENFYNLFIDDLNKLLQDYFEFSDKPIVNFYKKGNKYNLEVLLEARRMLLFGAMPKD